MTYFVPATQVCSSYQVKLRNKSKVKVDAKFEEKVALVKFYPGQSPDVLDFYLKKKYKGIVLEMGALGHVATKRSKNGWTKKSILMRNRVRDNNNKLKTKEV